MKSSPYDEEKLHYQPILLKRHFSQLATDLNVFLDPITQIPKLKPCLTPPSTAFHSNSSIPVLPRNSNSDPIFLLPHWSEQKKQRETMLVCNSNAQIVMLYQSGYVENLNQNRHLELLMIRLLAFPNRCYSPT